MHHSRFHTCGHQTRWTWIRCIMPFGLPLYDVCMRPEFMTSMSCDSVYCMCGVALSSDCVLADILNILCVYQFVFSVLGELYISHRAWCSRCCSKSALWKLKMWWFIFTRFRTIVRCGGYFFHKFFPVYNNAKLQKSIKISQSYDHNKNCTATFM